MPEIQVSEECVNAARKAYFTTRYTMGPADKVKTLKEFSQELWKAVTEAVITQFLKEHEKEEAD